MPSIFPNYMQDRFTPSQQLHAEVTRIGVFDSGVGGLTVLQEVYRQLPHESVLYFGDTARVPYGTRSAAEIIQFTRETLDWMVSQRVKMAIMACNTSSALALETVRSEYDLPILGVILPGARAAAFQGQRIGVIATPATVQSDAYLHAIQEANPHAEVWQVACPEFVPIIENNQIQEPATLEIAKQYLQPLLDRSAVLHHLRVVGVYPVLDTVGEYYSQPIRQAVEQHQAQFSSPILWRQSVLAD